MKVVKVLLAVLGAVLTLVLVAGLLLVWLFDPNDYKDTLAGLVSERTGRSFEIADELELSLFPWVAIETGGLTLGNAEGFGEQPMLTVERASARVKLLPLLRRRVEIGTIGLDGVQLDLSRARDGSNNWADLSASNGDRGDSDAAPAARRGITSLDIEGVRIRGGRVVWREGGNDIRYIVNDIRLVTGPIAPEQPVRIELALRALDVATQRAVEISGGTTLGLGAAGAMRAEQTGLELALLDGAGARRLDGTVRVATLAFSSDRILTLGSVTFTGRALDTPRAQEALDVGLAFETAALDPGAQTLSVTRLVTRGAGLEARWQLQGESLLDAPSITGTVAVPAAPLGTAVETLAIELPAGMTPASLGEGRFEARFNARLDTGQITLADIDASLLGATLTGRASLEGSRVAGDVAVPAFTAGEPLRGVLARVLPEDIDVAAFERLAFAGRFEADTSTGDLTVRNLEAELLGATLTGEVTVTRPASGPVVAGRLASTRFAPAPFVRAFNAVLTDTVNAEELGTLRFDTRFDYDTGRDAATLDPLAIEVFGLSAVGTLRATNVSSTPVFVGRAQVQPFAPRDLLRRFNQTPPATSDDTALARASIDTRFDITPALGRFEELTLLLDDSRITGQFTVEDFADPSYAFELSADRLDVDRYLPPRAEAAEPGQRTAGGIALSGQALDNIEITGRAEVADLKLAGMRFQNVSTGLDFGPRGVEIGPARANLYGGTFEGRLAVDATGALPAMSLRGQATRLALEPLIEALVGDANFSGTGSFDLNLLGQGETVTDAVRSAAGTMSFSLSDGVIQGFNLGRTLCQAYNTATRVPAPPSLPAETRYEVIRGSAEVAEGVASTNDLLARAAFMDITGRGRLRLVDQQLDYSLESTLTRSLGIERCDSLDRLIGSSFPWTLKGTVTDAEITPDFSKYLRERIEDEILDRARERLQDRLRNLL